MSEYIIRERIETGFTMVPKIALKDPKLSLKAKGLYSYLFSLPEDWKVYKTEIVKHFTDGKDSMNSAFKELEDNGYITSEKIRDEETKQFKGMLLSLKIVPEKPERISRDGSPVDGFPADGKPASNNTDNTNTGNTNNNLPNGKYIGELFPEEELKKKPKATKKKKEFVPPSLQQVKDYFSEKGYTEASAIKAFEYYEVADWHDGQGKKVLNWKQKVMNSFFRDENRIQQKIEVRQKISL